MSTDAHAAYDEHKRRLLAEYAAISSGRPLRLAKRTSNLFRARRSPGARLDVRDFVGVLSVDLAGRTADVLGMTTYEQLVEATLPHGLMPLVVPQLKTITIGGAVTGLGIESSSFRSGLPHESVLEIEVLTGNGCIVTARPDNEHRDLFFGFPNSYGTLGYALRLRIELEPVKPYVHLRHVRCFDRGELFLSLDDVCEARSYEGEPVDFIDGTVFGLDEAYLTLGTFTDTAATTSDYTGNDIYYRSLPRRREDDLTIHDYLWRWDTDWFWCSRTFGVQNPRVRRLVPKRWLRSSSYWRLVELERRYGAVELIDRLRGRPAWEHVVQDVEVPVAHAAAFFDFFVREIGIWPFWICPLRQRDPNVRWDLYALDPEMLYVNFGFWSTVALADGEAPGTYNRRVERVVGEFGGRKSLYSTSCYDRDEFWRLYNGPAYGALKRRYDPAGRLLDLYEKCVEHG